MTDTITPEAALSDGSPEAAGKALDALTAQFRGPAPSATPTDAIGARARLDALTADPSFSQAFFSGDQNARAEFGRLTAQVANGNPTQDALAGAKPAEFEVTVGGELNSRNRADAVSGLRELGLDDNSVLQAIEGGAVSPQEVAAAKTMKTMLLSNEEFTAKFMRGDWAARRQMALINTILASEAA
jgi:hypothetical protein